MISLLQQLHPDCTTLLLCGVVIAWAKFAEAESPTNILDFLDKVSRCKLTIVVSIVSTHVLVL
jgi:hypothetical protein